MTTDIIVLLLGIASSIFLVISSLATHKKRLLAFSLVTGFLCIIQYALVESPVALAVCAIGMGRSITVLLSEKYGWLNHWLMIPFWLAVHSVSFVIFADWANITWVNFLPLIGAYLGTIAIFFKNLIYTKAIYLLSGALWFVYELSVGVYGQLVGEGLNFLANAVAMFVLIHAARHNIPQDQVEDVDTRVIQVITTSIPVVQAEIQRTLTGTIPIIREGSELRKTLTGKIPVIQDKA